VPLARDHDGAPGLAAILSGLVPGLGQIYQERWIRGATVFLIPVLAVALGGAVVATFDPLTSLVVKHAAVFALAIVGGLLLYHLFAVSDAFASGFRHGSLRGKHAADYFALGLVTLALIAGYAGVYRGANAWAGLAAKVFAPVAGATARGVATSFEPPPWNGRDRLNVLVMGLDTRGTGSDTVNTDTMIVLSLDPVNRTAAMLSIPRDTLVPIAGHGQDKINAAYAYGGPDLAQKTVENLLGIKINSYAILDFPAFTNIVDSVGGVLVDVKRPIRDEAYPTPDYGVERLSIIPGPQLMTGAAALKYARSRHDSNDFSRARRQQDVIAAVRSRLASDGMIARVPAIVDRVGSVVETDFDPANILPLAALGSGIASSDIKSEVLLPCGAGLPHCELTEQNDALGYYLIPDAAKIRTFVAQLFYDPQSHR
jgi:LCP family protein required for cell wall assembly